MDYYIYKLTFLTAVHFGEGSLSDSTNMIMADTLFSALCCEAVDSGIVTPEKLVNYVENNKLLISDAMPYVNNKMYIPKPIFPVKSEEEGDSVIKKQFKKLKYIPFKKIDEYFKGNINPFSENKYIKNMGKSEVRTLSALRNKDEAEPYFIGTYKFFENSGLYIIVGFGSKEIKEEFDILFKNLSFSGIGGKRSSGFGRFTFRIFSFKKEMLSVSVGAENPFYISLSISMAKDYEIKEAVYNSYYKLIKRSGFIYSDTYSNEYRKKRDFFVFQSGSCFSKPFEGGIFDVSGNSYNSGHKVYRYCKPLFLEVK